MKSLAKNQENENLIPKDVRKKILKPISKSAPAGKSLRYDDVYDNIKKARHAEDDLPQGVWEHSLKESQWDVVEDISLKALKDQSKDLQLALWCTEALYHQYQAQGLSEGLSLTHDILKTFWSSFHPFSEDDPEYRVAPLLWFDRELNKALSSFLVARPVGDQDNSKTFWDYQSGVLLPKDQTGNEAKAEQERANRKKAFYDAVDRTDDDFYFHRQAYLKAALDSLHSIEKLIESHFREFPGCLMHARNRLNTIAHFIDQICTNRNKTSASIASAKISAAETQSQSSNDNHDDAKETKKPSFLGLSSQTAGSKAMAKIKIADHLDNRDKAYKLLEEIADYLSEIEPHSPTPHLIRRAVSWGDMTLAEVLKDLSKQSGDMNSALRFLGMNQ